MQAVLLPGNKKFTSLAKEKEKENAKESYRMREREREKINFQLKF